MVMKSLKEFKHYYLWCLVIGLTIPLGFIFIDTWDQGLNINTENLYMVFKAKLIYKFAIVFFPIIFSLISFLYVKAKMNNAILSDEFNYLKVILNSSPDAILFLDENLKVTFLNNQFRAYFDDTRKFLENEELINIVNNSFYFQKEIKVQSNIKQDHPFLLNFRLTHFNNKKNYFISLKDIKNLKDKEAIIEEQKNKMIESNKLASLGEMASGIAHEINNPLTVIHSNNSIIKKCIEKEELNKDQVFALLKKSCDQIHRITQIINSLRNLTRGLSNTKKEFFFFKEVVDESIELAKIKDYYKKIDFQTNINKDFQIFANKGQIIQIVINLLNNSIDEIIDRKDPWIRIESSIVDNKYSFRFIDSGEGVDQEVADKIFQPMYTTKEVGKGTGLGLSLSKSFIETNEGSIHLDTSAKNTTFVLNFKMANELKKVA